MINLQLGLDRTDARVNANAPFLVDCPLDLDGASIQPFGLLGVKLMLEDGMTPPARLSSVFLPKGTDKCVAISFSDWLGAGIGTCQVSTAGSGGSLFTWIYDDMGRLVGHAVFTSEAISTLWTVARSHGGRYDTEARDFVLIPECMVPYIPDGLDCIMVNGAPVPYDVVLGADDSKNISITIKPPVGDDQDAPPTLSVNVYRGAGNTEEDEEERPAPDDGICLLTVDNVGQINGLAAGAAEREGLMLDPVWVGGQHLVLYGTDTSNIRIVTESGYIRVKGVLDA